MALARRTRYRGLRPKVRVDEVPAASPEAVPLPSARELLPPIDAPLPPLDELLAMVPAEHREVVAFYVRDLDTGGWSVEERARHLFLILRLPIERRGDALDYLALLRRGGIDAAIISQQLAHLFLRPKEIAVLSARLAGNGASPSPDGTRGLYVTWGRLRLLAAVVEHVGISTRDAAREADIHEESARVALIAFQEAGLVSRTRGHRRKDSWQATVEGVSLVFQATSATSQVFARGSTITSNGQSLGEFMGSRPSVVLEAQERAYRRLVDMGFEDRLALRTIHRHRIAFIMKQIQEIEDINRRGLVRSVGKLLYFRLWSGVPEQKKTLGLANKVVPEGLKKVFLEAIRDVPFRVAHHLAYKLRKLANSGKVLGPADVWGTLNDIRKEDDMKEARKGA